MHVPNVKFSARFRLGLDNAVFVESIDGDQDFPIRNKQMPSIPVGVESAHRSEPPLALGVQSTRDFGSR
jgi:hypothetical protein